MANDTGRGSNLTDEDRAKGGRNSHMSENSNREEQSASTQTQGGTHEQHVQEGEQSHKND